MLGRHLNAGSMLAQAVHVVPQAGINGAAGSHPRCRRQPSTLTQSVRPILFGGSGFCRARRMRQLNGQAGPPQLAFAH